jgi:hypothetical protein
MRPSPDRAHAPTRQGEVPPTRQEKMLRPGTERAETARRLRAPLALLAGAALIAVLAQTSPGSSVLRDTGLVKPAPAYTSLFFSDPNALLTKVPFGHFSVDVPFSIHNASQATVTYQWTVQTVIGGKSARISGGSITEPPNTTFSRNVTVIGLCQAKELAVVVKLAKPAESIDYRAICDV